MDIEKFKSEYPNFTNIDLAKKYNISYRQAQRWGGKYNLKKDSSLISSLQKKIYKEGETEMLKNLVDVQEFSKAILDGLKDSKKLIKLPAKRNVFTGKLHESAVLLLGDIHCGQLNSFLNVATNKMEPTFNNEIMLQEFDRLLESISDINQLLSHSYHLDKLYIFGVGDYLENDVIYKGQRFFIDKGIGDQLLLMVKVMTDFFVELSKMFDEIEFVGCIGNHGRFQMGKDAAPTSNNFDYLMGKMLESRFEGNERIKITIPNDWWWVHQIYDWKYLIHHGDLVYSWMGIPFYGLKRQSTARKAELDSLGLSYNIECIGHFHQKMELPVGRDTLTIVNGSWIDKSSHGWRRFQNLSKAEQHYFGVSPKRARSWHFDLELLRKKGEIQELLKGGDK